MERDWDLRADELSARAIADGEPTAWFDRLYAEGATGTVSMPWDRDEPHVLLRDVNAPMLRKIQAQAISRSAPMLAEIIQQGVEEGVFDPPNPLETARLILQLGMASQDAQLLHQLEEMSEGTFVLLEQRAELLVAMLERMLGARPGSIDRLRVADSLRSLNLERADEAAIVKSGTE